MAKDLLFEIGTEEIPARVLGPALEQMLALADTALAEARLDHGKLAVYGTPRRLALLVRDVVEKQGDVAQEVVGPPARAAFTPDGRPTPAATGFAASQGGKVEDLKVKTTPKGEYVVFTRKQAGQAAETALPDMLLGILKGLSFPKSMTWESSGFRFIRPIRSLVALFGTKALKLSVAGVKSGRDTAGLFPTDRRRLSLPAAGRYVELLRIRHVLVDPAVRREQVEKLVAQAARRVGAARPDPALVEEVAAMVEYPSAVLGGFDPSHLHLPEEILVTCLRHHQKFFAVQDGRGRLVAHFVGVKNGISEHLETVREGYERVLAARLADAAFYWTQDGKMPLAQQAQKLSSVVFQEGLGSLADKAVRVDHLARSVAAALEQDALSDPGLVRRIARLARADLVTEMVKEFPELQGIVGRLYAARDGEPEAVARGIEDHYRPVGADGELPATAEGAVVALADRLDTLAAGFLADRAPTGSEDPWALRRAAMGALRICLDRAWNLDLDGLLDAALGQLSDYQPGVDAGAVRGTLVVFLQGRLETLLEGEGIRYDEVAAVLGGMRDERFRPLDLVRRARALHALRTLPDFEPVTTAYKRAVNIIVQAEQKGFWQSALEQESYDLSTAEPAERALGEALLAAREAVESLVKARDYPAALRRLVALRRPVDEFFEEVMVMVDDKEIRNRRLDLLTRLGGLFNRIANFSKIVIDTPPAK